MSLVLNTNIASLNAQNNLSGSQASLSQALERLSSGLRINSAADDAAGLAISQQFTTQINGTNQAVNNANDAVSETQTAGGALNTIVNNLQSIRTLAVEAANGSNSASDRQALDAQVQQQISEISQIAQQTSFNGLSVLNGSSGVTTYQVGANVGNTISVNLTQGVGANQIGAVASKTSEVSNAATTGALQLAVGISPAVTVGASSQYATTAKTAGGVAYQDATSAYAKAAAINGAGASGLTARATNNQLVNFTAVTLGTGTTNNGAYALSVNGVSVLNTTVGVAASDIITAINSFSTQDGGVSASASGGNVLLTAADGSNIQLTQTFTAAAGGTPTANTGGITSIQAYDATAGAVVAGTTATTETAATSFGPTTFQGQLTLSAGQNIQVSGAADLASVGFSTAQTITAAGTLAGNNVLTVAGANSTIQAVDSALATVSGFQSQLGAIQNRFTAAVGNLQSTAQNLTQSRSTIQDANFAAETANLTQSQVLEQAGISVLAQANQQPQLILKLLA
ncbi:MAG TPA: flagellin [Steroidobacteraceae bacterium]|nr:flagellin [Steroidobacteraceae bacterium]